MTHSNSKTNDGHDSCGFCQDDILDALYQLNVEAKRYGEEAEDAYNSGWKSQAREDSLKKRALYGLKRHILGEYLDNGCVEEITLHEIDGRNYYCFSIAGDSGRYSFHSPVGEWEGSPGERLADRDDTGDGPTVETDEARSLDSFDAASEHRDDHLDEFEALRRLSETFQSPNKFLPSVFVETDVSHRFAGWPSLPEAVEEGDRVSSDRLDQSHYEDLQFEVGDEFDTVEHGRCRITDAYFAWLTHRYDRNPMLPQPVYNVATQIEQNTSDNDEGSDGDDGDGAIKKRCIRQQTLLQDWKPIADSISDPLPDVDGPISERAGSHIDGDLSIEQGALIELAPLNDDEDPHTLKITVIWVDGAFLYCEFEPVESTDEAPFPLAIHEFEDDILAVRQSGA